MPSSLDQIADTRTINKVQGPPKWGCERTYTYRLKDDGGNNMGHVWIAERWPTNFGNRAAQLWEGPVPPANGVILDTLTVESILEFPYDNGNGAPLLSIPHGYYAATTDTSTFPGPVSGVQVKLVTTKYWTDYIDNP